MATLPRTRESKHQTNAIPPTPFSTSPRKLQEMTLPAPPEPHDTTSTSVVSLKQYEEQLGALRKENFQLKLRVYFLEEKLGTGAPPAVQGLLEHNVRLQVEAEELRRQLADRQQLLAAAAEAIDQLEHQGSISNESMEILMNHDGSEKEHKTKTKVSPDEKTDTVGDTCAESESHVEDLTTAVSNYETQEDCGRLRTEHRRAMHVIKKCMAKIQQQDKEIKRLKMDKELSYAHVSDSQMVKYEEILQCKDQHIRELETKLRDMQSSTSPQQLDEDNQGNLQMVLTRRLQGLAYFLDKLLEHKCVLGEDKQRLAESILEQSLALPVGLRLDESMAPADLTVDESALDLTQSLRLEDLTLMLGHHLCCEDKEVRRRQTMEASESECWSEPDRDVSLARIGLRDPRPPRAAGDPRSRPRRSRLSHSSEKTNEASVLQEEIRLLNDVHERLNDEKRDLESKLEFAMKQIDELTKEKEELKASIASERAKVSETQKTLDSVRVDACATELKLKEVEGRLAEMTQNAEKLVFERRELEHSFIETERTLRRAADEAVLHMSNAQLERTRAQQDLAKMERQLQETRETLVAKEDEIAQLQIEATRRIAAIGREIEAEPRLEASSGDEARVRAASPDLGIDSDRLSSLDNADQGLSPRSLREENVLLRNKLSRTKATLADALLQLNAANARKASVQRAICRQIHKTHGVLRQARDHLDPKH